MNRKKRRQAAEAGPNVTIAITWPEVAEMIFPEIQKQVPYWRGKSLAQFIAEANGIEMVWVEQNGGVDLGFVAEKRNG